VKQTKTRCLLVLAALCVVLSASCGMSKDALERGVASRFQDSLDSDSGLSGYGMEVTGVTLVKSGAHSYNGYVTVALDGEGHDIGITVTADGSDFMYETTPFAFGFLAEKALERLFDW
jgi:hypothetical protein